MRTAFYLGSTCLAAAILFAACTSTSNTNANINVRNASVNSNSGSVPGNAANSLSNAAERAMTDDPKEFVGAAARGGMAEIELSKYASSKTQNAEVKKFADMMVKDHTAANDELKSLAAKKNFTLPADLGRHSDDLNDLRKTELSDLDKDYVDQMVEDHEDVVTLFQRQADQGQDADLKAWAAKTLPKLKMHLETIKSLQAKMETKSSK